MTKHRFDLVWKVPEKGHRWARTTTHRESGPRTGPALLKAGPAKLAAGELPEIKALEPHPVLFRIFAEIVPDKENILNFANSFGNLYSETEWSPGSSRANKKSRVVTGVPLDIWRGQIAEMRRLTGLWDQIQREDPDALDDHFSVIEPEGSANQIDSHTASSHGVNPVHEKFIPDLSDHRLQEKLSAESAIHRAKYFLHDQLDFHLHNVADEVKVGMSWDSRREHPVVSYWCPTLLCAVWLQFATVVSENLTYGRCRECGKWFEIAPNAASSSRRFCSAACRTKAYRERQVRARQMHVAHKSFEEIAEELDSDMATVKSWITGIKG